MLIYEDGKPKLQNWNYLKKILKKSERTNFGKKVKKSLLELEKDCIELKSRKLKNREARIKRKIEKVFLNQLLCL